MSRYFVFVVTLVGTHGTFTHDGTTDDQGRTLGFGFRFVQSLAYFIYIVSVDADHFPTPCFIFHSDIFSRYFFYGCRKLDVVGVVKHDQVIQSQCSGNTTGAL